MCYNLNLVKMFHGGQIGAFQKKKKKKKKKKKRRKSFLKV